MNTGKLSTKEATIVNTMKIMAMVMNAVRNKDGITEDKTVTSGDVA